MIKEVFIEVTPTGQRQVSEQEYKAHEEKVRAEKAAFDRDHKTLYAATVHCWLPDGSWLKGGDTLRVVEGKEGKKALVGDGDCLESLTESLEAHVAELQVTLAHFKKAKELLDA